ncbi:MAG: alpha-D-ribose 1-methylphosphonate 5-triphosphate diphosphatase, partial [Pseudomonadota bacterium]
MSSSVLTPLPDSGRVSAPDPVRLANARLVLPDRVITGGLTIEGEHITEIAESGAVPPGAIDLGGDTVIPGLVELHTDNLERHMQPRPGVRFPNLPAILAHDGELASAGITTVFDALRVGSDKSDDASYRAYAREVATELVAARAAGALRIRHLIHLRAEVCSDTLIDELSAFGPDDRIGLISLMDHTPGQRQFRDISKLKEYHVGKYGMSDAAFVEMVAKRLEQRKHIGDKHDAFTVETARRCGAVLASHDDTTASDVAASVGHGVRLAEFPTTLEAAQACRDAGIAIIMGAPNVLRGGSHSGNVAAAELAAANLLDILSSDYVPSALLRAAFQLADIWQDLPRAIATVTANPADSVALTDRGRIAEGALADLVQVTQLRGTPVVRAVWKGG